MGKLLIHTLEGLQSVAMLGRYDSMKSYREDNGVTALELAYNLPHLTFHQTDHLMHECILLGSWLKRLAFGAALCSSAGLALTRSVAWGPSRQNSAQRLVAPPC